MAHAIFADGAGALAVTTGGPGPSIVAHRTLFHSEHLGAMGFEYPGGRPRVTLSKDVRRIGATMMREMATILMATQGLKREDIRYGCCTCGPSRDRPHAGALDLSEEQVGHSRRSCAATAMSWRRFFVLERRPPRRPSRARALMIGLGLGFAAEGALLRW